MSDLSLINKLELANIEFFKALYGCKTAKLKEGWLLWSDILPERFCNLGMAIRSSQKDAPELISQVSKKFKGKDIKPGFQITPATRPKDFANLLISLGFKKSYSESWMICKKSIRIPKLKKIKIIRVQTKEEMERFIKLFNSFGKKSTNQKAIDRAYEKVLWQSFKKKKEKVKIEHYLAVLDSKEVGFGTLSLAGDCALISNIGVLKLFRRRGIGEMLVGDLVFRARDLRVKEVFLQTTPKSRAQKFFRTLGFITIFLAEIFEKE